MTQFLPPNLLALFAARDPIPYLPPAAKLPHEKKQKGYDGVGAFLNYFEHPSETPPPTRVETREERVERRRRERAEQTAYKLEQEIAVWDPTANPRCTADPFKTLFVARVNYDTSESKLRREFEGYGAIKKIYMVYNKENDKPRGYAFIEYEHERDMHSAYKHADGKKIDGKRVLVDVERARTVKGWLPRRLGEYLNAHCTSFVGGWVGRDAGGRTSISSTRAARTTRGRGSDTDRSSATETSARATTEENGAAARRCGAGPAQGRVAGPDRARGAARGKGSVPERRREKDVGDGHGRGRNVAANVASAIRSATRIATATRSGRDETRSGKSPRSNPRTLRSRKSLWTITQNLIFRHWTSKLNRNRKTIINTIRKKRTETSITTSAGRTCPRDTFHLIILLFSVIFNRNSS